MKEQRNSGLPRALFCVRLLELFGNATPPDRLAFMVGAFIAADLDSLLSKKSINPHSSVLIAGNPAFAGAWRTALTQAGIPAVALGEDQVEQSILAGLTHIFAAASKTHNL
jgi:2-keto-3-deoxy-galactonokinase